MKVVWISWPGEGEYDVYVACKQAGIDIKLFGIDKGHLFGSPIEIDFISVGDIANVIRDTPADLYILRYPQQNWPLPADMSKVVYWASEQGPTRSYIEDTISRFHNVAVNNHIDLQYFKDKYPGKRILYLPFGSCGHPAHEPDLDAHSFIVPATPHFACGCEGNVRRRSVEIMVLPLLQKQYDLSLYGSGDSQHGWPGVPDAVQSYRGCFEHWKEYEILKRGRMYVGITWNAQYSGYGIKLARALSKGIPVMWQYTPGMDLDGLIDKHQIVVSHNASETLALADHFITHQDQLRDLGRRGQEWFNVNWRWDITIKRLVEEVNCAS